MAVLFRKFDITFKNETTDGACNAYCKLKTSEKQTEMSVTNYIMEYKHLYCAMIEHDTPFPAKCTSIQITWWSKFITGRAWITLTLANDIKFKTMKSALKRLFMVHHDHDENDALKSASFKQEKVYYSNKRYVKTKNKKDIYTQSLF